MSEHTVKRHIEECGRCDPHLSGTAGRPELGYMIPSLNCDHLLVIPGILQDAPNFQACPVPLQGLQEAAEAQHVVGFTNIQEHWE